MRAEVVSESESRLRQKFADALGPDLAALLDDARVCDVMINADGRVFVERVGEVIQRCDFTVPAAWRASIVKTAVLLGGAGEHRDGAAILETRIPGVGWRLEGILPPVTAAPVLSIRKPPRVIHTLDSYVEAGRMTPTMREALREAVLERRNILVVGGTGSGKTTLANGILREIAETCPEQRVVVLEDTPELQCMCDNAVPMVSTHGETMLDLLRASMRLRPDRIVVGEVRGAEAAVMLSAWNTGHPGGLCTVHADGARAGLMRLEQLCAQRGGDRAAARQEIAQAVHLVVYIERRAGHRAVREVISVSGLDAAGEYVWRQLA